MREPLDIAVVGAGAWGTALAMVASRRGHRVRLWARSDAQARAIDEARENQRRLPGIALPASLEVTSDVRAISPCQIVLLAVPTQTLRGVVQLLSPHLAGAQTLIVTAKGLESETGTFVHDIVSACLPDANVLVLSGPSFAADVARGLPTAVTLAGLDLKLARSHAIALSSEGFRLYWTDDVTGVALGGAMKNVLAIASGIVAGKGLGESARAALIARAFAELSRLAVAEGARPETLAGLSGLGDLVLTCSSPQSRNFALGLALGQGLSLAFQMGAGRGVAEGVMTAQAVASRAAKLGIEVPICAAVDAVLRGAQTIDEAIAQLLGRPLKGEA